MDMGSERSKSALAKLLPPGVTVMGLSIFTVMPLPPTTLMFAAAMALPFSSTNDMDEGSGLMLTRMRS